MVVRKAEERVGGGMGVGQEKGIYCWVCVVSDWLNN